MRETRPHAPVVEPSIGGRVQPVLRFQDERVERAPVGGHEPQPGLRAEPLAHRTQLAARGVEDAQVPEARRLVHVRGDQEEATVRLLAHEPDEPVAPAVDGRHERFDRRAEDGAAVGGGRRRGRGDALLSEAVEDAADLLLERAVGLAVLAFGERGRDVGERALRGHRDAEALEQRARRPRGIAHDGLSAGFSAGAAAGAGGGAAAFGNSASRASTWSVIQCASHHSTGSTWMPRTMTLKWR